MSQTAEKSFSWTLTVELVDGGGKPEKQSFTCRTGDDHTVNAGVLKGAFLMRFDATASLMDEGHRADQNQSYHLLGLDETGSRTAFTDEDSVDLRSFTSFELVPRTVGGAEWA